MTALTPAQEEALNRAIAEFERIDFYGFDDGVIEYVVTVQTSDTEAEQNLNYMTAYTRDLNAIVPVVQRWMEKQEYKIGVEVERMRALLWMQDTKQIRWPFCDNPALALCLAFAQAAGLKGDWK